MKAIYRTSFQLGTKHAKVDLFDAVAKVIWKWVFDPKRIGAIPKEFKIPERAESLERVGFGRGNEIESLRVDTGAESGWGLHLSHPDSDDHDLRWTTELTLYRDNQGHVFFACSLLIGRPGSIYIPLRRRASRPRIVEQIVSSFEALGAYPLHSKPIALTSEAKDIATFVKVLGADTRTHPIVFVTRENDSDNFLVDPKTISSHLAGIAHVVIETSSDVSRQLSELLPSRMNCYDGGIRIYWPRFRKGQSPFVHPLWVRERLQDLVEKHPNEVAFVLLERIAEVTIYNVHDKFLTWSRLEEMGRRKAIEEAKAAGNLQEWSQLLEDENKSLSCRIKELEGQLASRNAEFIKLQVKAENFQAALDLRKETGKTTDEEIEVPPTTVTEAIQRIQVEYGDELVFAFNSKSEHQGSPFQEVEEFMAALEWLATDYYQARSKGGIARFDHNLRESLPAWDYSAKQSELAKGRFKEWYRCSWNGRTYDIEEHIGCGSSTRPEETIRIAFAWDGESKRVVIGYIGQHQKNTCS